MAFLVKLKISKTDTNPWLFRDPTPPSGKEELAQAMQMLVDKLESTFGECKVKDNSTMEIDVECPTADDFNRLAIKGATLWSQSENEWIDKVKEYHIDLDVTTTINEI